MSSLFTITKAFMVIILLTTVLLGTTPTAHATLTPDTCYWTGKVSRLWNDPSGPNWRCLSRGEVIRPNIGDHLVFDSTTRRVSTNNLLYDLQPTSLTIFSSMSEITVGETLTVRSNITLKGPKQTWGTTVYGKIHFTQNNPITISSNFKNDFNFEYWKTNRNTVKVVNETGEQGQLTVPLFTSIGGVDNTADTFKMVNMQYPNQFNINPAYYYGTFIVKDSRYLLQPTTPVILTTHFIGSLINSTVTLSDYKIEQLRSTDSTLRFTADIARNTKTTIKSLDFIGQNHLKFSANTFDTTCGKSQLEIASAPDLSEVTLSVSEKYTQPTCFGPHTLISNTSTQAVETPFVNLPEGAKLDLNRDGKAEYYITYRGNDGNDVVIMPN